MHKGMEQLLTELYDIVVENHAPLCTYEATFPIKDARVTIQMEPAYPREKMGSPKEKVTK